MISHNKKPALKFDPEHNILGESYPSYVLSFKKPQDSKTIHEKLVESVQKYAGYSVALSGGYDSQFSCLMLKEAEVDFDVITYKLNWKQETVNSSDVLACEQFCKTHNLQLDIQDIDGEEFFEGGIFGITGKKYKSNSPQISLHCYFLEKCNQKNIICGGDIPYPIYSIDNRELNTINLVHALNKNQEGVGERFLAKYHLPYDLVAHINDKTIVKNLLYDTDEIYYMAMDLNYELINKHKILFPQSPIVQNYRYKEYYYNHVLKDNKLSFRFGQANGFENLKNYFAVISGNYDEFNDKYRRAWANHHIFTKLKGSPDELNELTDKFKLLGKQEDLEFLFDFSSHL
jgi:hypothetical protein